MKSYNKITFLKFISLFILLLVLSGCKSQKKITKYDDVYINNNIEFNTKNKKDKGKSIGEKIAEEAKTWLGTPYGYGRADKGVATDCSGMVVTVYEKVASVKLPRNSAQQAGFCDDLKEKDIVPGDLVFFATGKDPKKISHVGVMVDNENFVHASTSKGVIMSTMTTPYYRRTLIRYGRVPIQR